jgi:hypothetical protein
MTSRNSRQLEKESNVFFMVLMATCERVSRMWTTRWCNVTHTRVPRRAMWAPAVRTRASATLPKLPSPISFITSYLSSREAQP